MITIGTAKFDMLTDNELFARTLNGRWDAFFHASFEVVVEEVLSVYDRSDHIIDITSLSLDLGDIEEENFHQQFPLRLREALVNYCKENIDNYQATNRASEGIRIVSTSMNAFEMLTFFLLHGYFPFSSDHESLDLNLLLRRVVSEEAYRFREFLNAYGHYDFVYQRLVFQFDDEQLDLIVNAVQPSESKFINLYVRVQIQTYPALKKADITRTDYRNAVWILVFAYLFAESGGYFNRKQIIVYTLRGLAAHLNYSLAEITRLVTENIQKLQYTAGQLPELWRILKDIRQDMQSALWQLDGDYHTCLMREVVSALRSDRPKEEVEHVLLPEHLVHLLGDTDERRKLLQRLNEQEVHRLVAILIPHESEYIISYACLLDKHRDAGTFTGKAGSEFRLLKWEFIFAVLTSMPTAAFSRKQFVLSVLQHLAAHYNLSVEDLIRWLYADEEVKSSLLSSGVFSVLEELAELFKPEKKEALSEGYPLADLEEWIDIPLMVRRFVAANTERHIAAWVIRFLPVHGEFMVGYALLLDKGHDAGMLAGKAGGEFRALKWEFIFSCFSSNNRVVFHRKLFVYSVLKRLAAHYNQEITTLISYFLHQVTAVLAEYRFGGIREILKELYEEHFLQITDSTVVRSKTDKELQLWAMSLFGTNALTPGVHESYLEKWLVYFLDERNDVFRMLWKSGRLDEALVLRLVNRTPALRNLWLRRIKDGRLLAIYQRFLSIFAAIRSHLKEYGFIDSQREFLSVWMVELTTRKYLSWSEKEIVDFLVVRVHCGAPRDFIILIKKMSVMGQNEDYLEAMKSFERGGSNDASTAGVDVYNGGMMLISPYFPMLFSRLNLLTDDRKEFRDMDSRVRAIFLLQNVVYGEQREWTEAELYLNKLMVGMVESNQPLPRALDLKQEEIDMVEQLMKAICQSWDKMRNTSVRGFREAFLQRRAQVKWYESEHKWQVAVEVKAYDVLIDSMPWGYKTCKQPWHKQIIEVKWR